MNEEALPQVLSPHTYEALWRLQKLILDTPDFEGVVSRVVNSILTELDYLHRGYRILVLTLVDPENQILKRIALSQTPEAEAAQEASPVPFEQIAIPLTAEENLLVRSLKEKKVYITHTWPDIFRPVLSDEAAIRNQQAAGIQTSLLYPLLVGDQATGVMIFSLVKSEDEVERDEKELLSRFTEITSLAVRNARMYSDIQAANEKLQELDHLKDEFISYAAHELRTPLTAVRGYAHLLLGQSSTIGPLTPKQADFLKRIAISSERVVRLVNNLLDVSRMQAGRYEISPQPTDPLQLVQEALSEVMPLAQEQKQTITITPPSSPLHLVEADRDKIKEVLINILGNAVKFTPAGGSITISFAIQDNMVFTTIKDNGQGICPEDMQYIFQEYGMVKKNNMRREEHQGTGLGLYISRAIVRLHGGDMTLASEGENKGTSVSFSLKIAGQQAE